MERKTTLLAIPEMCADKIMSLYYSSVFPRYQGVLKHI